MAPDTILARLLRTVVRVPDTIAYDAAGSVPITWGELGDVVRRTALGLAERGVVQGEPIAVLVRPPKAPAAELAVMAAGGVSVWLPDASVGRLREVGARRCLTDDPSLSSRRREPDIDVIQIDDLDADEPDHFEKLIADVLPDDAATVTFTEGNRAGVAMSHRQIVAAVDDLGRRLPITSGGTTVAFLDLDDMIGRLTAVYWPATVGARVRLATGADPLADIRAIHPTVLVAGAAVARALADAVGEVSTGPRRRALELGRLDVAGERLGRLGRAELTVLRSTVGVAVREELGLAACRVLLMVEPVPAWIDRELRAAGLPITRGRTEAMA
ncbi:MAG: AMP-binding protein [Acidimicrobiales bacterium]